MLHNVFLTLEWIQRTNQTPNLVVLEEDTAKSLSLQLMHNLIHLTTKPMVMALVWPFCLDEGTSCPLIFFSFPHPYGIFQGAKMQLVVVHHSSRLFWSFCVRAVFVYFLGVIGWHYCRCGLVLARIPLTVFIIILSSVYCHSFQISTLSFGQLVGMKMSRVVKNELIYFALTS